MLTGLICHLALGFSSSVETINKVPQDVLLEMVLHLLLSCTMELKDVA